MSNKSIFYATSITLSLLMTAPALAQDAGMNLQSSSDQFGMQAGMRFSIPLGATRSDRFDDRAKLQFTLSATRAQKMVGSNVRDVRSSDMFSIGFDQAFQPRLSLNGQDLSYAAFPAVYANDEDAETDEASTNGGNTALIVGGIAVLAVSTLVIYNEVDNDISDFGRCFLNFSAECRDN